MNTYCKEFKEFDLNNLRKREGKERARKKEQSANAMCIEIHPQFLLVFREFELIQS